MAATFVAFSSASAAATSVAVAAPAGVAAGDHQLAVVGLSGNVETVTTPAGWTLLQALTNNSDPGPYQTLTYISSTADAASVTFSKSGTANIHVVRVAWRGGPGFDTPGVSLAGTTSTTSHPLPSVTTTSDDSLVIGVIHMDSGSAATTYTPPAGWTERVDITALTGRSIGVFEILKATAGAQAGTVTSNRADYSNTFGVALSGLTVVPTLTDAGDGVDTPTVSKTEFLALTDAGDGVDTTTVFADNSLLTDAGDGVDTLTVNQLVDVALTDSGDGVDTVAVADFVTTSLTDAGDGVDTIALVQTNFVDLTDAGDGVDTTTLLQQLNTLTDAGDGVDTIVEAVGLKPLTDSGDGVDVVSIVVIPFTAEQRLTEGTIYDLVVVARVPQADGPPTFIEVDPIEWESLTYSNALKAPQELTASCLISSVPESIWQRLRALHELATELWLYRDGQRVFAGPLQGWQTSGEKLQLSCKGLLQYLRSMVVHTDKVFAGVDQNTIVKTLVDQWQALSYGHFGIDTSRITPSGQLRTVTYLRNELNVVGTRVEELGKLSTGFDAEIDPASRELLLWSPVKGVNRGEGEDAIIFDARNITSGDILCSVAGGDLASEAYGNAGSAGSDEALFSMRSNDELRARYGRTGVTGSFSNEKSQAALNDYVQGLLDARAQVLLVPGPKCRVTPDADLSDYAVGDSIAYDLAGQLGINQSFRIRKQTITVSSTGQESVDLEFV